MTNYELAKQIYRDLSPVAPKLSAALNRALIDIGEGSVLYGLEKGMHKDDVVTFYETEIINIAGTDQASIIAKITEVLWKIEGQTSWKVIIDKRPGPNKKSIELFYTLIRSKDA
ncbi:MAG: hypothetical protein KKD50_08250 [Proteobacteria bacterium]|nr:hypothetical protein [Pseudomonadota bacterium]